MALYIFLIVAGVAVMALGHYEKKTSLFPLLLVQLETCCFCWGSIFCWFGIRDICGFGCNRWVIVI